MSEFMTSGSGVVMKRLATTTALVGLAAVGLSLTLDKTLKGGLPQIAIVHADGSLVLLGGKPAGAGAPAQTAAAGARNGVDMTAVGSINALKIDPCTGQLKR